MTEQEIQLLDFRRNRFLVSFKGSDNLYLVIAIHYMRQEIMISDAKNPKPPGEIKSFSDIRHMVVIEHDSKHTANIERKSNERN